MLILISHPETFPKETALLNSMLGADNNFIFHLRKSGTGLVAFEQVLLEIDPAFHPRIVIHQHHELAASYELKGVHFTASDREKHLINGRAVSTSFHSLAEAEKYHKDFGYFFCSPVFPSISKQGYQPTEKWDISQCEEDFRERAVALGGITALNADQAKAKGFRHLAVLGAVWQSEDPQAALAELIRKNS